MVQVSGSHESVTSLQASVPGVHGSPGDTQMPVALQASTPVQNNPSLQEYPVALFVHDVLLEAPLQYWQG
jgi:hypothetical protein